MPLARILFAVLIAITPLAAQSSDGPDQGAGRDLPPIEDTGFIITTESNLVVVPLHVYKKKKSINGLGKDAFELLEDGNVQEIAFVEGPAGPGAEPGSGRQVPIELVFLVDVSHSVMRRRLLDIHAVRGSILKQVGDNVNISLYGFAGTLKRFTGPTNDAGRLERALDKLYGAEAGQSKVFEAILRTAIAVGEEGGNASKMLIVFSDGLSTTGFDPSLAARAANHYGVPVYPVVLGHQQAGERANRRAAGAWQPTRNRPVPPTNRSRPRNTEREKKQEVFANLGRQTGGQSFDMKTPSSIAIRRLLTSVAKLANTEYVVGYYPKGQGSEPAHRQIEVRLRNEKIGKLYGGRRLIVH